MATKLKPWYMSRTILLATAQGAFGIIVAILAANPEIKGAGLLVIIKSFLDIVLRMDTRLKVE